MADRIIVLVTGIAIGVLLYHLFFRPEVETETIIETIVQTDTTYRALYEKLKLEVDNYQDLSDSVGYYQKLYWKELGNVKLVHDTVFQNEPFSAPLRRYTGLEPSLYGDVSYNALVAGKLLSMDITTDFRIPEIKTTIERRETATRTIKPNGLYGTGGISSDFQPSVGAVYLNDRSLIGYEYNTALKNHAVKVGFKIF